MLLKLSTIILATLFTINSYAQVVATVGSVEIKLEDFKKRFEEVKGNINPPTPQQFLEDVVRFEMGVLEAERQKLRDNPKVKEGFKTVLYKELIEKEIGAKVDAIKVTEAEMRRHYQKNPEIRSSHILIEFSPSANAEQIAAAQKRAEEILKEVKASKRPFEELVRIYSDDNLTKENGGDIGFQSRVTIVPTYYDAILSLKPNQIGGPVRTLYGFHIVKATGRRSYQDANKRQIRAAVFDEKRQSLFDAYFKTLSRRYPVKKEEGLLRSIK